MSNMTDINKHMQIQTAREYHSNLTSPRNLVTKKHSHSKQLFDPKKVYQNSQHVRFPKIRQLSNVSNSSITTQSSVQQ